MHKAPFRAHVDLDGNSISITMPLGGIEYRLHEHHALEDIVRGIRYAIMTGTSLGEAQNPEHPDVIIARLEQDIEALEKEQVMHIEIIENNHAAEIAKLRQAIVEIANHIASGRSATVGADMIYTVQVSDHLLKRLRLLISSDGGIA